ncbi:MAG TPA: PKD domain-containing protein [Phycisphaerae bacterium]|nr:PKD domain-containing protein [Phycisphaerae bacterium]HNU46564.1 PKD domain-containing protein [Phycisphaerae bacterium]
MFTTRVRRSRILRSAALPTALLAVSLATGSVLPGCDSGGAVPSRGNQPTLDATIVGDGDPTMGPATTDTTGIELRVTAKPVVCCNPLSYDLTAELVPSAYEVGAEFTWDFGDGRNAGGPRVTHTFPWADTYLVVATVRVSSGEVLQQEFRLSLDEPEVPPPGGDNPSGDGGNSGNPDEVVAPAEAGTPTADAGPDQTVSANQQVVLDGTGSRAAGSGPLSFLWVQTGGPGVTLADADQAVAGFVAPAPVDASVELTFRLTVTEGSSSAEDSVVITVTPSRDPLPSPPDEPEDTVNPPGGAHANAGPDQSVTSGTLVHLDGTGSSGPPDLPLSYTWRQEEGPRVSLVSSHSATPSFRAPQVGAAETLVFRLTVRSGTQADSDTVAVTVAPPVVNWGTPPAGATVWFLSGPAGPAPSGPAEVTWTFVGGRTFSEVKLLQDCCNCPDQVSDVISPDADGVYRSVIEVPNPGTVWYSVLYTVEGVQYRSQSVYVNPPTGGGNAAPPPVIWYYYPSYDPEILHQIIRSGVFTHVMLHGDDRVIAPHDGPNVLRAVAICQAANVPVIWSRHLWNSWAEFETMEDVFDPDFYAGIIAQVQAEAAELGIQFTSLDCEAYGNTPLKTYLHSPLDPDDFARMSAAVQEAAARGRVDFAYPIGNHSLPLHPNNVYAPLCHARITEDTFYDQPHFNCRIRYEYEVFGAYVRPATERSGLGLSPFFLACDILERRFLWSAADGAPGVINGIFVYPDAGDAESLNIATAIADHFAGP